VPFVRERWFAGESFSDDLAVMRASAEHWCRETAGTRIHGTTRRSAHERGRVMAPKTISPELKHAMKELRLGQLLPTLAERIALAEKNEFVRRGLPAGVVHRRNRAPS